MNRSQDASPEELHRFALVLAAGAAQRVRRLLDRTNGSDGSGTDGSGTDGSGTDSSDTDDAGAASVIESKSTPTDLVTATDRDTEHWLVTRIGEQRPQDAILGEESGPRPGSSAVRWVLDPIDGTVNFVLGLPQYAVSVAAELDGEVVAGAVANPATGELFHGYRGGGAWLRRSGDHDHAAGPDIALTGPRAVSLDRAVVATGFGYDSGRRERQIAVVAPLLPRIGDLRRLGAAALDLCFLAAGRLDAYFEAGLNPWDHAAGGLIASEAGCVVTGPGGRAGEQLLVAAGPELVEDLVAVLTELGADTIVDPG